MVTDRVDGHGFIDRGGGAGNLIGARLDVFGRRHGDIHRLRGARLNVQCGYLGGLARRQEAHLPARGGVGRKGVGLAGSVLLIKVALKVKAVSASPS